MASKKANSRLITELHETAEGLHSLGLITKKRMLEYEYLRNLTVPPMPAAKIKSLRERVHISQAVLAAVLNTSVSTVQKWEVGDKKPNGPSLKLLSLIERKGLNAIL
jgi:putative transcriptional regulator